MSVPEAVMKQPDFSNKAQQAQEQESAADVVRARKDAEKLGARLKTGDGANRTGGWRKTVETFIFKRRISANPDRDSRVLPLCSHR
jgi:hypothetical protein